MSLDKAEAEDLLEQLNAFSGFFEGMISLTQRIKAPELARTLRRAIADMHFVQDDGIRRPAALEHPDLFEIDDDGYLRGNATQGRPSRTAVTSQPSDSVASRSLKLTRPINGCARIDVNIYRPISDESGMWSCEYEIVFPDRRKRHAGKGADSWQALTAAIAFCQASVLASEFASSGLIDWEGDPFEWPRDVR